MPNFSQTKFKWTFRDYQQTILDHSQKHLKDKKIHIVAAPGSGKTTLGLELIRRLDAPALVMSPSVTIRQQWGDRFIESFLPDQANASEYISYNLFAPKLITSITYQALHAAFTKDTIEETDTEDEFETEEKQNYADFDLLDAIKKAGISTICLDEAHHLKSEWQRALEKFLALLGEQVTVISLTATPPYDSTPAEWARYSSLCGDIDEEIFVPQLVMQKTLCPHQDYLYFNYPTQDETVALQTYQQKAADCTQQILQSGLPLRALQASGVIENTSDAEEILYDNLRSFAALVCIVSHNGAFVSQTLCDKVYEGKKPLSFSMQEAETAFQFIIDNPAIFTEVISNELKTILSKEALIEKRKVRLVSTDKLTKMLTSSMGKLESIQTIVNSEFDNLGEGLRMLILTDFIKKDLKKLIGTDEEIHAMGTVPVFEALRRSCHPNAGLAVLSGSLVILPNEAIPPTLEIADQSGVAYTVKPFANTHHSEVIFSGSNKNKVGIITKAFQQGHIHVLIGTKSLLGEGWDSPNINSLILASFVGSFMLSNQMRGRAIRIDNNNPEKKSNIWHLVTVEPENPSTSSEISGSDFETMQRRFSCFQAPAYHTNTIESGMDRIDILQPPYNAQKYEEINRQMLALAADREQMARFWSGSVRPDSRAEILQVNEVPTAVHPKQAAFKNKLQLILWAMVIVLALISAAVSGWFLGFVGVLIALLALISFCIKLSLYLKTSSPEKSITLLARSVLKSLKQTGDIDSPTAQVSVKKSTRSDMLQCSLEKATVREKNLFAAAISEMLSPIDDPRYLIIANKNPGSPSGRTYVQSYACPAILGVKKETAEILAANLKQSGNKYEVVFTRSEAGRKELFKCRKHSYININGKIVGNKKVVKS